MRITNLEFVPANQSPNCTCPRPPNTNTKKSTPSHKPSKFSLESKRFLLIQNPLHPSHPQFHSKPKTRNQIPKSQPQFAPKSIHPKTRENTLLTQSLPRRPRKSPEASRGQAAASRGHAYAQDASSEDPDPREPSFDQSERAVGRYKSCAANQLLATPLKSPLAPRAH